MSEYVKEVNESNFEQVVLQSEKPVLVDFWRNGRTCRALAHKATSKPRFPLS